MSVKKTVVIGLSGGVDSAVAAMLLKEQGHEVIGLFMKNWEDDDSEAHCSTRQDLVDAVAVADHLGIEIEAVNFSAEYKDRVFKQFLSEYAAGRTPNPDVLCNSEIKFKAFLDHALQLGADHIATGHYAKVREVDGRYQLLKADDGSKDQSYFLYRLNQQQLAKTWFPLGQLYKREVREIAKQAGLPNHDKKDSTGICFIGERPFREFLNRYLPANPGRIVDADGHVVGKHMGLTFYTLGQRQGLGIGGTRSGDGDAWYVAAKDMARNELVVVQGHNHPRLLSDQINAIQLNWISGEAPHCAWVYSAKSRYRQVDSACALSALSPDHCVVEFSQAQWAATPGQSVVLYESNVCLGGGVIESTRPALAPASDLVCPPHTDGIAPDDQ